MLDEVLGLILVFALVFAFDFVFAFVFALGSDSSFGSDLVRCCARRAGERGIADRIFLRFTRDLAAMISVHPTFATMARLGMRSHGYLWGDPVKIQDKRWF